MSFEIDTNTVGSVGSIIGAAFESSGHYLQSEVLQILDAGLATSFGSFLLVFAGVAAILIYAVGGNYKYALWFFIGVPIFWFTVNQRVPSSGARWQLGARLWDQSAVVDASYNSVGNLRTASGEVVYVSWVFAQWNELVSGVVQNVVNLFDLTDDSFSDLQFLSRGDRYFELFNAEISDPNIKFFFNQFVQTQCSENYVSRVALYDGDTDGGTKSILKCQLHREGNNPVVTLGSSSYPKTNSTLWTQVIQDRADARDACLSVDSSACDPCTKECGAQFCPSAFSVGKNEFSCNELWDITVTLFRSHASQIVADVIVNDRQEELPVDAIRQELIKKFTGQAVDPSAPWATAPMSDDQATLAMINEVSARMILREIGTLNPQAAQYALTKIPDAWNEDGVSIHQDAADSIRSLSSAIEFLHKGNFITSVLSLPYLQGMGLFFLAMSFPFFAMAIIVPGRAGAIFTWCGLWVWLKSWDIGMAMVMLIDKVLFALLPHGPPIGDDAIRDPGMAFKSILEVDPTYSSFMYYNCLATLMVAIPLLSGLLVQRGGMEIVNAISQGYQNFGGRVGHSMSQFQRSMLAQQEVSRGRQHIFNSTLAAAERALEQGGYSKYMSDAVITSALKKAGTAGFRFGGAEEVGRKFIEAEIERIGTVAVARYREELNRAHYNAATDVRSRRSEGIYSMYGIFPRRLAPQPPTQAAVDVIGAEYNPHINDSIDKLLVDKLRAPALERGASFDIRTLIKPAGALLLAPEAESEDLFGIFDKLYDRTKPLLLREEEVKPVVASRIYGSTANDKARYQREINTFYREVRDYPIAYRAIALATVKNISNFDPNYRSPDDRRFGLFGLTKPEFDRANEILRDKGMISMSGELDIFNPEHNWQAAQVWLAQRFELVERNFEGKLDNYQSYMEGMYNYQFAGADDQGKPASDEGIEFARRRDAGTWVKKYEQIIRGWGE